MKKFIVALVLEVVFVTFVFFKTRTDNSDAAAMAGAPRMLSVMLCVVIDFFWGVIALLKHL